MDTELLTAAAQAGGESFWEYVKPLIVNAVQQLEGPYRWYVIGLVISVLTAVITRFIFKTFKWFILLILFGVCIWAVLLFFSDTAGL